MVFAIFKNAYDKGFVFSKCHQIILLELFVHKKVFAIFEIIVVLGVVLDEYALFKEVVGTLNQYGLFASDIEIDDERIIDILIRIAIVIDDYSHRIRISKHDILNLIRARIVKKLINLPVLLIIFSHLVKLLKVKVAFTLLEGLEFFVHIVYFVSFKVEVLCVDYEVFVRFIDS